MPRPTLYKEEYSDQMYDLMSKGEFDCNLCTVWGISRDTFYVWLKKHDDFREAHDRGKMACEAFWIKKGLEYVEVGNDKAFKYWIALMNNKFGWGDKKYGGNGDTNITNITNNVGEIKVLNQRDRQQNIEFLKEKLLDYVDVSIEEPRAD